MIFSYSSRPRTRTDAFWEWSMELLEASSSQNRDFISDNECHLKLRNILMERKGAEHHLCINYCNSLFMGSGRRHQGQLDPVGRRYRDDLSCWLRCFTLEHHHRASGIICWQSYLRRFSNAYSSKYKEEGKGLACKAATTGSCKATQGLGAYCT